MELGDLWVKIANNLRLTSQEQDFLRRMGTETQQRNTQIAGWTGADGNANLSTPTITSPVWKDSPLGAFRIGRSYHQEIPTIIDPVDYTNYTIDWDLFYRSSRFFAMGSNNKKIEVVNLSAPFQITVNFKLWATAGTYTFLIAFGYDQNDVQLFTNTMFYGLVSGANIGITIVDPVQYPTLKYISIICTHGDVAPRNFECSFLNFMVI
jgi:hypothetical protein